MKAILKPGREKSVIKRHPWIFSGAVDRIEGDSKIGDTVEVFSSRGDFLAWASFSPYSQIRMRIWSWERNENINRNFFRKKLLRAIQMRKNLRLLPDTNAFRLVNSESDGLPGFIVDKYANILVLQCTTAGAEKWKDVFVDLLVEITGIGTVYERSDVDERKLEGLPLQCGYLMPLCLRGTPINEIEKSNTQDFPNQEIGEILEAKASQPLVEIMENNLKFFVDIRHGHKTGFYLDQRDNRLLLRDYCAGKDILNCFCYTGGFTINALAGGARSVVSIDTSAGALDLAKKNVALNDLGCDRCEWIEEDVFESLRNFLIQGRAFDLIILDPPKFAVGKGSVEKALRGYKDINMLAFKLLRSGGILFTFSCSGLVSAEMFQNAVAWAALDADVHAKTIKRMTQSQDHPVSLNFPEGEYLKGLIVSA